MKESVKLSELSDCAMVSYKGEVTSAGQIRNLIRQGEQISGLFTISENGGQSNPCFFFNNPQPQRNAIEGKLPIWATNRPNSLLGSTSPNPSKTQMTKNVIFESGGMPPDPR